MAYGKLFHVKATLYLKDLFIASVFGLLVFTLYKLDECVLYVWSANINLSIKYSGACFETILYIIIATLFVLLLSSVFQFSLVKFSSDEEYQEDLLIIRAALF